MTTSDHSVTPVYIHLARFPLMNARHLEQVATALNIDHADIVAVTASLHHDVYLIDLAGGDTRTVSGYEMWQETGDERWGLG